MKMHDINPEQEKIVLLLHPMLVSARLMEELLAVPMGQEYRYLIPDFSGHGDDADKLYESATTEAAQIRTYLSQHNIQEIALAFGASMGGAVLLELLHDPGIQIHKLFFEGTSMYEDAGFISTIIRRVMLKKQQKAKAQPELAHRKMTELYGEKAGPVMAEHFVRFSPVSLVHVVADCSHIRFPELTEEEQKNCIFAYGEKDGDLKKAKKICPKKYPAARLSIWPGCGHCTFMTEDPERYAAMLTAFLNGEEI